MHARRQEISGRIEASILAKGNDNNAKDKGDLVQVENIKMPSFYRKVRNNPQFKTDFANKYCRQLMLITNYMFSDHVLERNQPIRKEKSLDDDINAMWKRAGRKIR